MSKILAFVGKSRTTGGVIAGFLKKWGATLRVGAIFHLFISFHLKLIYKG